MNESMCHVSADEGAIGAVLDRWSAYERPFRVFALLPEAESPRLDEVRRACCARQVGLVGAIFPALIVQGAFGTTGVWLCRVDAESPAFLVPLPESGVGADAIVRRVNAALPSGSTPLLHLIFDTFVPDIASIVEELYIQLADRVAYAGVAAGSERFVPMPCLFDDEQVLERAVLVQLLPPGLVVMEHGYPAPEQGRIATSTDGNRIRSIGWRPAVEVYAELVYARSGIILEPEHFYACAVHRPLGIARADGEVVVRIPVATHPDGSVYCVGEVPENAVLVLLDAPVNDLACVEAIAQRLGPASGARLAFYCAGRRGHLGEGADRELAVIDARVGPVGGALSLGEVGATLGRGYPTLHNACVCVTEWAG